MQHCTACGADVRAVDVDDCGVCGACAEHAEHALDERLRAAYAAYDDAIARRDATAARRLDAQISALETARTTVYTHWLDTLSAPRETALGAHECA